MSNWVWYFCKYYFLTRFKNLKIPILAGYKITYNCNIRCLHCPYWRKESKNPNYEEVLAVLEKMHHMGARILIFEGGEPFLWKDHKEKKNINDIILYAKNLYFSVGVTTNGTIPLIDVPADVIWVSFDGMRETYKKIRGDFFDKVVNTIKTSNHPNLNANITINKVNYIEIQEMIKFISQYVKGITIQFHYPYGIEEDDELLLDMEKRREVLDKLISLKKDGYPLADSYKCLEDMKENTWLCHDWMLVNANPDGQISQGCYLKSRGNINCKLCGFAAHVEISKAFDLSISSINVGRKIFRYRNIAA